MRLPRCGGGWPRPITLARAPIDPNAKLQCVSYAPFRGAQTPLVADHCMIAPEQIAQDLAQLAKITDCVRTYSIENGLDQVPALAAKVGLKVIQGIWLGSNRLKNLAQISTVGAADQGISRRHHLASWSATRCCCAAR